MFVAGGVNHAASGVAIKQTTGGSSEQPAELRVPHHPAGRAVPVVAFTQRIGVITAANIIVQTLECQGHQHGSAMAVHNGLGQPRGTTGVDNPQGMIKRQPKGLKRCCLGVVSSDARFEKFAAGSLANDAKRQAQVVLQNDMTQCWQRCTEFSHHSRAVKVAAPVTHAIAGNQNLRFNLFEAVQHRTDAHVRSANAPYRADADACQKRHHRLGRIGQISNNPVPRLHAVRLQIQRERSNLTAQLGPAQAPCGRGSQTLFVVTDDGRNAGCMRGRHMPQHLLRIVDLCANKPPGMWHRCTITHHAMRAGRTQIKIVPDTLPERVQVGGGPAPQRIIRIKRQAAL